MTDTLPTFLRKTAKMSVELSKLEHRTVEVAALAVKASVTAQMAAAGVNGGRLRGVGKRGAKIGVRYDITDKKALVRATGPFHLIERDTKAHRIPRERKTTRAKKRTVNIPGVGLRAYAEHPGTSGKHPWKKGVVAAMPIQHKAQGIALHQSVMKAYR